ncbi:Oxidoreductase family, NAD-binding Rossmann fold [Marinomonas spartinae]|uniref:Oxidoreductase family, NAD-binding Rossmann fold n=1 Tax=Marinomonas spartinae TaxID=1792290 RepID=A0A1A8T0V3_9GAMM|nr:Gfo/Idh/MocA family oxidoreductase [Marinomonas spartinae]SBS25208.1 Oxidoreductase family, NAD-binding Rossmann fold [Marinomonas spartinae]
MRILVCGTNYGSTYIRALAMSHGSMTLVGILSTGSARSKAYAQHVQIPHYSNIKDIPDHSVDIACVAVPGEAGQVLVLALLEKGIHVLCEHPIGALQMRKALELAQKKQCVFQVNAHFSDLYAPQAFYNALHVARQAGECLHYELSVNLRTLYSGLDLLGRALGTLKGILVSPPADPNALFVNLTLSGPSVNVSMLCQNFASEADDGSATLINHRMSATFPHGNLLLAETNGPVLWFPSPVSMPADQWQNYLPVDLAVLKQDQLMGQRDGANLAKIQAMESTIQGGPTPLEQEPEYLLQLSALWEETLATLQPELA